MIGTGPRRPDALVTHIVNTHHTYVRRAIPDISDRLREQVRVAGAAHPELPLVLHTFQGLASTLLAHLDKEEHLLFPYVLELSAAGADGRPLPYGPFGTVANPVRMMEDEHEEALTALDRLRALTHHYAPPSSASASAKGLAEAYYALQAFDADLREHVRLEDHELFPMALDLEARLT